MANFLIDTLKQFAPIVAVFISSWALFVSYKTNRHKDNFEIAKQKYFSILVDDLPQKIADIEYEPNGNIKQDTTIDFLKSLDNLREKINHLLIIDESKYKKIIDKLENIDNSISTLSTTKQHKNFKETKEWKRVISNLHYIIKTLLLNI
ncbi:hypothetical protein [Leuconostoc mesenteroides]|uniref:hypothetical protein n=1 Tax=Leuconostoc mesenteroides TaxID=1245 RepID=UPI0005A66D1F|nr:hypothetical protein [Leuconostoc mesenteroides]KAA8365981.1 hypothetical protein FE417_07660 [Leuconostoc mesenteroides]MDM7539080.1 hypothetical protein [Leuconostoc mesenteroides]